MIVFKRFLEAYNRNHMTSEGSEHEKLASIITQAKIFVIHPDLIGKNYQTIGGTQTVNPSLKLIQEDEKWQEPVNLPFQTCWFEYLSPDPEAHIGTSTEEPPIGIDPAHGNPLYIGFLYHENGPDNFFLAMFQHLTKEMQARTGGKIQLLIHTYDNVSRENLPYWFFQAKEFAMMFDKDVITGSQKVNEVVKIKESGEKRIHRIKRIVHVYPKKKKVASAPGGGTIDWSHRSWWRGHWRNHPGGLGKNRSGEYCIQGKTWVIEHIRGPDHLPLIEKTRLVHKEIRNDEED